MATIEERVNTIYSPREEKTFFDKRYNEENAVRKSIYIKGATEQKQIDIERLKDILNALMIDTRDKVAILTTMEEEL